MHSSKPFSGIVAGMIGLLLVSACGKIELKNQGGTMSEQAAFKQLAQTPSPSPSSSSSSTSSTGSSSVATQAATPQNLNSLLTTLIASGKIKVPGAKAAIANGTNPLDLLSQILSMIQGGQANSVLSLVNLLIKLPAALKGGDIVSSIDTIVQILTQALPIITPIAPQFVPVINSLLVILPMVEAFLKLVVPTPTPSAYMQPFPWVIQA